MKHFIPAIFAFAVGTNGLAIASSTVTGTAPIPSVSFSHGPYVFTNGTNSSLSGTGTGVLVATSVRSAIGGLYTGALPPGALQLIEDSKKLDELVNKAREEAEAAIDSLLGALDLGGNSTSAITSSVSKVVPRAPKGKAAGKPSKPRTSSPPPTSTPLPPVTTTSAPPSSTPKTSTTSPLSTSSTSVSDTKSTSNSISKSNSPTKSSSQTSSSSSVHSKSSVTTTSLHTKSTSTNSHAILSSTSTSIRTKATSLTPLCGAKTCRKNKAGTCALRSSKLKKNLKLRSLAGSSLQVRALTRRYPATSSVNKANYAHQITAKRIEKRVLYINTAMRWPNLEDDEIDYSTAQALTYNEILADIAAGKEGTAGMNARSFNIGQGKLTGCTGLFIVSEVGVYYSHYWENLAFDGATEKAEVSFTEEVTTPLFEGKKNPKGEITQDSLIESKSLFVNGARAFIMTPSLGGTTGKQTMAYAKNIDLLKTSIKAILNANVPIQTHIYQQADDGWYSPGKAPTDKKHTKVRGSKKNPEYQYADLIRKQTGSDGYGVFQYTKHSETEASIRLIFEDKLMYEHSWNPGMPEGLTPPSSPVPE